MKNIKLLSLVCTLFLSICLHAQTDTPAESQLTWYTDLMKANEVSQATGKPIFGFFTGSDWCGWCKKLQKEVFAKPEFIEWAAKNVILVEFDFPRNKEQSPELVQQNRNMQQQFQVQGYPTIWMFTMTKGEGTNFNIEALGSLGYPERPEKGKEEVKFLANANSVLANKKAK